MASDATDRIEQRLRNITTDIKRYFEKKLELFAITIAENYTEISAKYLHKASGLFFLAIAFIFLLVALAEFIGALLQSQPLGYVIVAVPLILVGWLFYNLKPKSFSRKVQNELEEDVIDLLSKYEIKTGQELSAIQIEESKKEKKNDGSK